MGNQQIASPRLCLRLQIFEIADQDVLGLDTREDRRMRRGDRGGDLRTHLMEHCADREEEVRLGPDGKAPAANMKMPIEHRIDELTALPPVFGRHGLTAYFAQEHEQIVIWGQPAEAIEESERNICLFHHCFGGRAHLFADRDRPGRAAHSRDVLDRNSANGGWCELVGYMTVERSREIRQEVWSKTKVFDDCAKFVEIAWSQMATGENVDALVIPACFVERRLDQSFHQPCDRLCPAILERVLEVGSRDIDDREIGEVGMLFTDQPNVAFDVIALCFGDAR